MKIIHRGKDHWNWRGGIKNNNGYVMVYQPKHPHCDQQGYVRQHRLVMEEDLGRLLEKDEVVHHINGNRADNVIENLQLLSKKEHDLIHLRESGYRTPKGNVPWNKGVPHSNETKKKISESKKKKKIPLVCKFCKNLFLVTPCRKIAVYCGRECYLRDYIPWNKGGCDVC